MLNLDPDPRNAARNQNCLPNSRAAAHRSSSAHRFICQCSWRPAPLVLCWCRQRLARVELVLVAGSTSAGPGGVDRQQVQPQARQVVTGGGWGQWKLDAARAQAPTTASPYICKSILVVGRQQRLQLFDENGLKLTCRMFRAEARFEGYLKLPSSLERILPGNQ